MPAQTKNDAAKAAARAWDHTLQARKQVRLAAEQLKPAARSTREAATRRSLQARAWAVQQSGRGRQFLRGTVARKAADLLRSAAQRIESGSGRTGRRAGKPGGDA